MSAQRVDVHLVVMPYFGVERASLGLGVLKAGLSRVGISSKVHFANIAFAEDIGIEPYTFLSLYPSKGLLGEWTFGSAAFPEFRPDDDGYLRNSWQAARAWGRPTFLPAQSEDEFLQFARSVRESARLFVEEYARRILDLGPRIVGTTSTFQQHVPSLALLKKVKELAPEVLTVIGGANCEGPMGVATAEFFPWVDYVFSGEADEAFPVFCREILEGGGSAPSLGNLPSSVIPGEEVRRNPDPWRAAAPRGTVEELDGVPPPDYSDFFEAIASSPYAGAVSHALPVEMSRGCWWGQRRHCTFCGLNGTGITYRSKSDDRVLSELGELRERYSCHRFEFVDNIVGNGYSETVLPRLEACEPGYTLFMECKPVLSRAELEQMARAGVATVQPGIESLHFKLLKAMGKPGTPWGNIQLLKWALEAGVGVVWLFLVDIPGEEDAWYQEMEELIPLLQHLPPPGGITGIHFMRFSPYQERPAAFGLQLRPASMYEYVYPLNPGQLERIACYFDLTEELLEKKPAPAERPGWAGCYRKVLGWMQAWEPGQEVFIREPPTLTQRDAGDSITIIDQRSCAVEGVQTLEGIAARIYRACDVCRTLDGLLRALQEEDGLDPDVEEVKASLEELARKKILVSFGERYLSLATRRPPRHRPPRFTGAVVNLRAAAEAERAVVR